MEFDSDPAGQGIDGHEQPVRHALLAGTDHGSDIGVMQHCFRRMGECVRQRDLLWKLVKKLVHIRCHPLPGNDSILHERD